MRCSEWKLVRFRDLQSLGLWSAAQRPCERSLRATIASGLIPYYQISGMLFFQPAEVRHSVFEGTLATVAA
jgi:hypothetical protein